MRWGKISHVLGFVSGGVLILVGQGVIVGTEGKDGGQHGVGGGEDVGESVGSIGGGYATVVVVAVGRLARGG